jgi:hypothetical protein
VCGPCTVFGRKNSQVTLARKGVCRKEPDRSQCERRLRDIPASDHLARYENTGFEAARPRLATDSTRSLDCQDLLDSRSTVLGATGFHDQVWGDLDDSADVRVTA